MKSSSLFFYGLLSAVSCFFILIIPNFLIPLCAQSVATRPVKSLSVGNIFVYEVSQSGSSPVRYYERVISDSVLSGRRYAVVYSSFDKSIRFERSDDSTLYLYKDGSEIRSINFYAKTGDILNSLKYLQFNCYPCNYPILKSSKDLFQQDTISSINTDKLYIDTRKNLGIIGIQNMSSTPSGRSEAFYKGAVINGIVHGDTSLPRTSSVQQTTPLSASAELRLVMPNPFTGSTKVSYSLGRTATVSAAVYSTDGLRILTLLPPTAQITGEYSLAWNGTSSVGANVAAGQYFVVLFVDDKQVGSVAVIKQ